MPCLSKQIASRLETIKTELFVPRQIFVKALSEKKLTKKPLSVTYGGLIHIGEYTLEMELDNDKEI